jgi:SAM-dependent methyltransferase
MASIAAAALLLGFGIVSFGRLALPALTPAKELRAPRALVPGLLLSFAAWIPAALTVFVAARALAAEISPVEGARVFCASTLFGGLTLMPAGFGVTGSVALLEFENLGFARESALPVVALFRWTTTGFALSLGLIFLVIELLQRRSAPAAGAVQHFDEIARTYEKQYAPHMWRLILDRKVGFLAGVLPAPPARAGLGLDLGCGLGYQCAAMREKGFNAVGVDPSLELLRHARTLRAPVFAGDGISLPFADGSFDFVYAIGVLHHLPGRAEQEAACIEALRVLRPGGSFLVLETNTKNPIFRFYMGYIFPLLKTIDEGTELWVGPTHFEQQRNFEHVRTQYFTFVPDTIPKPLLPVFLALEKSLESGRFAPYAVHYLSVMRKPVAGGSQRP